MAIPSDETTPWAATRWQATALKPYLTQRLTSAEARAQVEAKLAASLAKATKQYAGAVRRALAVEIAERLSQASGQARS